MLSLADSLTRRTSTSTSGAAGWLARASLVAAILLFVCAAASLMVGVRTMESLPFWFWPAHPLTLELFGVIAVLAVAGAGAFLVEQRVRLTPLQAGSAVFALALAAQWGLALAEGRGIDGMRDRAVLTGHAEFVFLGSRSVPPGELLEQYEKILGQKARFVPTKPPGQLLAYRGLSKIANVVMPPLPPTPEQSRHIKDNAQLHLTNLLMVVLPIGAALAAMLLVVLARRLALTASAVAAGATFALTAPLVLITLHFDQAVYPLLTVAALICAACGDASPQRSWAWGIATGLLIWTSLFVSFSLLGAVPLVATSLWTTAQRLPPAERSRRTRAFALGTASLSVPTVVLYVGWHYNPWLRYQRAMKYHAAWKHWDPTVANMVLMGMTDLVEFAWWMGPVVGPLLIGIGVGAIRIWRRKPIGLDVFAATLGLTILALAFAGSTAGEVARLWIFLLPAVALVGVNALKTEEGPMGSRWAGALVFAQAMWAIVLKAYQDFV